MNCKTALQTILDHVDYTAGMCQVNEMVGAVLPKEIILLAKQAIALEGQVEVDVCDCGEPFPENGYCKFCGTHRREGE